LCIIIVFEAD